MILEISDMVERANAAVLTKYGETVVLVTVVMSDRDSDANYMPLKVDYEEKFYAAGKIIGSRFIRREGRPSEEAILTGRLVDRAVRPLFDSRIRRNIQVVVTVLAIDEENDPDFAGLMGTSVALAISDVPWGGPVSGVRVAKIGDAVAVNPDNSEMRKPEFSFETFVSGTTDRINMIELSGREASEKEIVNAFDLAQNEINKLIDFQKDIVEEIGKPKAELVWEEADPQLRREVEKFLSSRLEEAIYQIDSKAEYHSRLADIKDQTFQYIKENFPSDGWEKDLKAVDFLFEEAVDRLVHKNILEKGLRPDGRALDEIRNLEGEVGLFERTHGSAFFGRGNTHALAITTLGPPGAEQLIETMEMTGRRRFLLHYNFPPYSVGEIGTFRGPGRREIGHGALAEKALRPLIPDKEKFPYTIRVVSEIMASNGSSSMATVCSGAFSLMDAGVPLLRPAAGIAMGLMLESRTDAEQTQTDAEKSPRRSALSKYKILTDIQGPEDYHGDMDLKVAGTEEGVTAIQMDVKVDGLPVQILEETLKEAKKARLEILKFMKTVLAKPREEVSKYAPIISQLRINPEKIGMVIGPGGKMINGLIKKYELEGIDIEEDGLVSVSGSDKENVLRAVSEIKAMTREYEVGEVVEGKIVKILDFGAIMDLGNGRDGMIHISELEQGFVKNVKDVVKVGDFVRAKVINVEEGKIGLSIKQLKD